MGFYLLGLLGKRPMFTVKLVGVVALLLFSATW